MPRVTPLKLEIYKKGLIQGDVAEVAGISESRLSRILNCRVVPCSYELKNLARAVGLTKEELTELWREGAGRESRSSIA